MTVKLLAAATFGAVALLVNQPTCGADFEPYAFVTASIGQASSDYQPSVTDVIDDDDTSFTLGLGYAFSPHWSVQGRYHNFGEHAGFVGCPPEVFCIAIVPFAVETVDIDGWSAVVDGAWPVSGRVSLFARAGVLAWDVSAANPPLDISGEDLLYGAGVDVNVSERWHFRFVYERANVDIESIQLGVRLIF